MRSAETRIQVDPARDLRFCGDVVLRQHGSATAAQVTPIWRNFVLGQTPAGAVLLVRSVARARRVLLKTLCVADETVVVPANATAGLVEAVKRANGKPRFANLDAHLRLALTAPVAVAWAESVAGLPTTSTEDADLLVVDYADSVPLGPLPPFAADVLLFGLHLTTTADDAGALLVCREADLARRISAQLSPADEPDWARAAWQLQRLHHHLPQQQVHLAQLRHALDEAAGLPGLANDHTLALPFGIAVQIPPECAPSTFYHYACGENTPIQWLPFMRPLHPAAVHDLGASGLATAAQLERWVLAPLGLKSSAETLAQTVLGIVKAAEYLGVRWRTQPQRAAAYAVALQERYGPGHDAYRPTFTITPEAEATVGAVFAEFAPPPCRVI